MLYWFGMVLPSSSFCTAGSDGSNIGVLIETMSVNVHQSASDAPIGLITFRSGLYLTNLLAMMPSNIHQRLQKICLRPTD